MFQTQDIKGVISSEIDYGGWREFSFCSDFGSGRTFADFLSIYRRLSQYLRDNRFLIIDERIFCLREVFGRVRQAHRDVWGVTSKHPFSLLEGAPVRRGEVAGFQIKAAAPRKEGGCRITRRGAADYKAVTVSWDGYRICYLNGFQARVHGVPLGESASRLFSRIFRSLRSRSFDAKDIVRTWFYIDRIHEWYSGFNKARGSAFQRYGLGDPTATLPASTGIGIYSGSDIAVTADLLLAQNCRSRYLIRRLYNPLQREAPEYGSFFSRGVRLEIGKTKVYFVSGTASIGRKGESLFAADSPRQISRTLQNVKTLLDGTGVTLCDIKQATVYFRRAVDFAAYRKIAGKTFGCPVPSVCMLADICRPELKFEIEAVFSGGKAKS